jgi:hypothetical protein
MVALVVHHEYLRPHTSFAHRLFSVFPSRPAAASRATAVKPQMVPDVWMGGSVMGTGRTTPNPSNLAT